VTFSTIWRASSGVNGREVRGCQNRTVSFKQRRPLHTDLQRGLLTLNSKLVEYKLKCQKEIGTLAD
jgi:hypothetical protein